MLRICSLFALTLVLSAPDSAASGRLQGPARLIDGDTVAVGDVVVRLHGIDAPENDQPCVDAGGDWACGLWARDELGRLIGDGPVTCTVIETDRYGRAVAQCLGSRGDLGAAMVLAGAAVAYRRYSLAYVGQEEAARQARRGVWRAEGVGLLMPAEWRAAARADVPPAEAAPAGCEIKGNISRSRRIYHRPGQQDYANTRINLSEGEQWFCSEAEAEAAGWRPARR